MSVAATSLDNLIPQSRKWPEFSTTPIRVPANLKQWVLDMVNQKVAELRLTFGGEPTDLSEDTWIREIVGLPADYQLGDTLPESVKQEVANITEQASVTVAHSGDAVCSDRSILIVDEVEPAPYTQAWIDWSEKQFPQWKWTEYLEALKLDVAAGCQDSKAEIANFKTNGVNVGDAPQVKLKGRAAKMARRAEQAEKSGARHCQSEPAPELPDYDAMMDYYCDEIKSVEQRLTDLYTELSAAGLNGKIKRFQNYCDTIPLHEFKGFYPTPEGYRDPKYMAKNKAERDLLAKDLEAVFYITPAQRDPDNFDARFYQIMMDLVRSLSFAIAAAQSDIDLAKYFADPQN